MMIMIFKGPPGPPPLTLFDEDGSFFWTLFLILKKGSQKPIEIHSTSLKTGVRNINEFCLEK